MALFLTTRGISSQLEEILIGSESFLYILTPYLRFSNTLYERLIEVSKRGIEITIVCKDRQNLLPQDERMLLDLHCNILFKRDIHAKCYINEHVAMVASMNLYNYSEANNREMGVLLSKKEDKDAYGKCLRETNSIIGSSEQFRMINNVVKIDETEPERTYEVFQSSWLSHLKNKYPENYFLLEDRVISSANFPFDGFDFSTHYGFATLSFPYNKKLIDMRSTRRNYLETLFDNYRLYWPSGDRICLYHAKEFECENLNKEIEYCNTGLEKLINVVSTLLQ